MPTTYSVLMHHIVRGSSLFNKTVIAEVTSSDMGVALLQAYENSRVALTYLPFGEITLFVGYFPKDGAMFSCILDCSISYEFLFI